MGLDGIAHQYAADRAPEQMRAAAEPYRLRFGDRFATLTWFSRDLLAALHTDPGGAGRPEGLQVAADHDARVAADLAEATEIANLPARSTADRAAYRDALLRIYRALPVDAVALTSGDVLCVGPEREGRQLADALGSLPESRSITPSAKRIPYGGGILVGLSELPAATPYRECVVIDGVVASGATVMALLHTLPCTVEQVTLLTAQSTSAGARAILRYAGALGLDCRIVVGVVSGALNTSFYATDEDDPSRMVLGDVGDTISGLATSTGSPIRSQESA